jgi:hypothetical protein
MQSSGDPTLISKLPNGGVTLMLESTEVTGVTIMALGNSSFATLTWP